MYNQRKDEIIRLKGRLSHGIEDGYGSMEIFEIEVGLYDCIVIECVDVVFSI